jgi:hypothetical protein
VSINLTTHYAQMYSTNVDLLLQRQGSILRDKVDFKGGYVGKQASPVDQIGSVEARRVTSRFADMGRVDAPTDRRWVFPLDFDLPQLVDHFDKLRLLTSPESALVKNGQMAMGRAEDDVIVDAFFADAKTGEAAGTTTSFPAGNQIAVNFESASNVGLTVAKLREVRRLAKSNFVRWYDEQMFIAITSGEDADLLKEIEIINLDYTDRPVLREGRIDRFLGMQFVDFEALDTDGSSYTRVPVWAKSGMHLAQWEDFQTSVSKRNDLQGEPWQAYILGTFGATRLEEDKVYEIKCA